MKLSAEELKAALTKIFDPNQALFDKESLQYYGKDWTTYFDIKASAIVFPKNSEQVINLVKWARQNKVSLIPSGGRTGLSGGACALNDEIIVSFEKMNQISEFNPIEQTVVCQAGVITEQLQNYAKEKSLFYPVDFAARGSSQIGGNVATNAGGIKVLRYGLTRDWVVGLKVVTGAGELLNLNKSLIKNATGYDFRHLFIGSEGTLGFITEVTIKLTTPPLPSMVLVLGLNELESVMKVFQEFRLHTKLTAFEMFSELALQKVIEQKNLARPFASICPFYVLLEVEQADEVLECFEKTLAAGWVQDGSSSMSETQAKSFWRLREDISEALSVYSPYKNDISVPISKVPDFMRDLDLLLSKSYPTWEVVWFGHLGDGNLHINILRPTNMTKEQFVKECRQADVLVYQTVQKYMGAISAEHGVGLTKKSFLSFSRSEVEIAYMRSIKTVFDPDGIINPGKLID